LTRQKVPVLDREVYASAKEALKGFYILKDSAGEPDLIILASGSEVSLALEAANNLETAGKQVRVVSCPCWELFEAQSEGYKELVLPQRITKRLSIEAGSTMGWEKYVGSRGTCIGVNNFGASAPAEILYREYGLTADHILDEANSLLDKC